jgi:hypothetical protein
MEPVQRWIEQIERLDDLRSRVTRQMDNSEPNHSGEISYEQDSGAVGPPPEGPSPETADVLSGPQRDEPDPSTDSAPGSDELGRSGAQTLDAPGLNAELAAPPILGSVTARAVETDPPRPAPSGEQHLFVNAPASVTQELSLEGLVDQWLAQSIDTSFRSQLDRRLLLVLAGKYEDARRPLEMVSNEQQQVAAEFVEALIAIREGHGGDPSGEANRALGRVEALMDALIPLSELRISTLALTRAVRGFGRYEVFDPAQFPAGCESEFIVYCELGNFVSRSADAGRYESLFSMRTAVLNRAGDIILEFDDDHIADECQTRRHDCFIPRLVRLPATLSPGEYVVKVTIIDKIAGKVAERRTTFRIVARS